MKPVVIETRKLVRKWGLGILFFFIATTGVYSNVFNVNNTTDGNAANQLRGAIAAAVAAGAGPHTINVAAGIYDLTLGQISFGNTPITLTIVGAGPATTIINMTSTMQDRIFFINPSGTVANVNVTIQNLSFTNGHLKSDMFGGGAILGGGPSNALNISNCVFTSNTIDATAGTSGGAVAMEGGGLLIIDQCTFAGNSNPKGGGGALFYFLPNSQSGSLSVTNSIFSNNSVTANNGDGGAILITIQGAIGATSSSISIQRNIFISNHADATGGNGGAIAITNSFGAGNTAQINFNRFAGNTSIDPLTTGLAVASANGNVDANNNWWSCNTGPSAAGGCNRAGITGSGGTGVLLVANWLQLKTTAASASICSGNSGNSVDITTGFTNNSAGLTITPANLSALTGLAVSYTATLGTLSNTQNIQSNGTATATFTSNGTAGTGTVNPSVDNVPNTDMVARVSVTVNASPAINMQPQSVGLCPGNEATFSVAASGSSLTYVWFNNTTPLSDGQTPSGSVIAGSGTSTLAIRNPTISDNSTDYNVLVTGSGCSTRSGNTQLTVPPLVIANANTGGNRDINTNDFAVNDPSCNRVALVQPSGIAPVSGVVDASVTIDAGQPSYNGQPYVKRHYDIAPSANTNTATATVTLYFLQSEFDSYNAATPGTTNDLPTNPGDATGRSNLRVTQYHGLGTSPGNYTGWAGPGPAHVLINPGGGNIVWNSTNNWWEVTFPVTGFSGFFITGLISNPLPVTLRQITANKEQGGILVQWQVSNEAGFSHYEVETGTDGRTYHALGTITATNNTSYSYLHNNPVSGINYYRLKMVDLNGSFSYSRIVSCLFSTDDYAVRIMSNPFRQNIDLRLEAREKTVMQLVLTDQAGKILLQKNIPVNKGNNTITIPAPMSANGMYLLRISGGGFNKTLKVIKSD